MILNKIKSKLKNKFTRYTPIYICSTTEECLIDRIALITGGSSGIGKAMAKQFVKSGAKVIITGRNENRLKEVVSEIGDNSVYYVLDNVDTEQFEFAFEEINSLFGNIDILVNNAGIIGKTSFPNMSVQDWDNVIATNLRGPVFLSQVFVKHCIKNNIKGNILNIGSSSCLRPAISSYTMSKWGIRGFTLGLAKSCAKYGITVNGIAPGPTATPILGAEIEDYRNDLIPAGRFAACEEIASMAVKLVSESGRMIIGDMVYMTGGAGNLTFDDIIY